MILRIELDLDFSFENGFSDLKMEPQMFYLLCSLLAQLGNSDENHRPFLEGLYRRGPPAIRKQILHHSSELNVLEGMRHLEHIYIVVQRYLLVLGSSEEVFFIHVVKLLSVHDGVKRRVETRREDVVGQQLVLEHVDIDES